MQVCIPTPWPLPPPGQMAQKQQYKVQMCSEKCTVVGVGNGLTIPGVGSVRRQQCVVQSDSIKEEAVAECFSDSSDALVTSARWQKCEQFMRVAGRVIHNTVGLSDTTVVVGGIEG